MKRQILVVDRDLAICQALYHSMQDEFTDVCYVTSEDEALISCTKQEYSLVILNAELAMMDSIKLLLAIRSLRRMPIMVIGGSLEAKEKILLFHAGADAYMDAPLDIDICTAQANALIQLYMESATEQNCSDVIIFGTKLVICPRFRQAIANGKALSLTKKEFDLLYFFAKSPKQVFSRVQLYEQVWNEASSIGVDEIIKAHIKSLRKKLSFTGQEYIQTVWGTGYRFVLDNSES